MVGLWWIWIHYNHADVDISANKWISDGLYSVIYFKPDLVKPGYKMSYLHPMVEIPNNMLYLTAENSGIGCDMCFNSATCFYYWCFGTYNNRYMHALVTKAALGV